MLAFGIILLFTGIIAISATANLEEEKVISSDPVDRKKHSWEVSGNFSRGKRLKLTIAPGKHWYFFAEQTDEYDFPHLIVQVTICDSLERKTELEAIFVPYPGSESLDLLAVKLISNSGGLTLEKSNEIELTNETGYYKEISGIVNCDGIYKARVDSVWLPNPPAVLTLYCQLIKKEHPYWFVIPMGGALIVGGAFLSMWAAKKPKHKLELKKEKRRVYPRSLD